MKSINTFVYGYGWKELGKVGTKSDITIMHFKSGESYLNSFYPHTYPEKIIPMAQSLASADVAVLFIDKIDWIVAEILLGCQMLNKQVIIQFKEDYLEDELKQYVKMNYKTYESRDALLDLEIERKKEPTAVMLDHIFPVKGVGTVGLGLVISGVLKKHQVLNFDGQNVEVRSIQVQDEDFSEVPAGTRVGVALKNITHDKLYRGAILQNDLTKVDKIKPKLSPYFNNVKGKYYAVLGMQTSPVEYDENWKLEKPLYETNGLILDLNKQKGRIIGGLVEI